MQKGHENNKMTWNRDKNNKLIKADEQNFYMKYNEKCNL